MIANKSLALLCLIIELFVTTGCVPSTPSIIPIIQQEPTSIVTTETPVSLVQSNNESKEQFIVRIASSKIISKRPFLIALSEMKSKRDLWQGVSPEVKAMEKCLIVDVDLVKQCEKEDIRNYIGNPNALKIFFASAYSDSGQELIILDDYHPEIENDTIDGYRLVLELKDGKWVEKSLTQVY